MDKETLQAGMRKSVKSRMAFIEFRLFWEGQVNRKNLKEQFEISDQQASSDFTRYQEIAENNIEYDKSRKKYVPTNSFTPRFWEISAREYITHLRLISEQVEDIRNNWVEIVPSYDVVPFLRRRMTPEILKPILTAIKDNLAIKIMYSSMRNPVPSWRWVSPHSLAFDGRRWHTRAWCYSNNKFRDFVFARIREIAEEKESEIDSDQDLEWNTKVQLKIIPHPLLSKDQKKLIEYEYEMTDGCLDVEVRSSLVYYVEQYLNLNENNDSEEVIKEGHHLYLENRTEVKKLNKEITEKSKNQIEVIQPNK